MMQTRGQSSPRAFGIAVIFALTMANAPAAAQDESGTGVGTVSGERSIGAPPEEAEREIDDAATDDAPPESEAPVQEPAAEAPAPIEDQSAHNLKLRAIEERVNTLKEKIFQSKARLIQLQEVVLHGTITGSKAVLVHRNEMGSSFRLWQVQYALDGAPIFNRSDSGEGELGKEQEIEVFNGSIAPGNHQLAVYLEYRGHGYGLFSYLKDYKFKIKSSYTFTAEEGKVTTIRVVGYEKGGITTQLKDRPSVRYDQEVARELRRDDVSDQGENNDE